MANPGDGRQPERVGENLVDLSRGDASSKPDPKQPAPAGLPPENERTPPDAEATRIGQAETIPERKMGRR